MAERKITALRELSVEKLHTEPSNSTIYHAPDGRYVKQFARIAMCMQMSLRTPKPL